MRRALALCLLSACGRGPELMTVVPEPPVARADGTLGSWEIERPVPTPRANHCAAAFGDFLIVAGGNYKPAGATEFVSLDDVVVAKVGEQGALGEWRVAGRLPSPGVDCVLAVSGHTLVLAGALFTDSTLNARVWTSQLADDGTLGAWTQVGTLPYDRRALGAGAQLYGSTLWLTDARLPSEGDAEAVLATTTLGGTFLVWTSTPYAMAFRGRPLGAFTASNAFIIGGYGEANTVLTDVTALSLSGAAPVKATPLPEARSFGAAAAADGWLFVTGGRTQIFGVAPVAVTYSASARGAELSAWAEQRPLPEARSNHTATVVRDQLFVVGGGNGAGGLDTVFRARVKHLLPAE